MPEIFKIISRFGLNMTLKSQLRVVSRNCITEFCVTQNQVIPQIDDFQFPEKPLNRLLWNGVFWGPRPRSLRNDFEN